MKAPIPPPPLKIVESQPPSPSITEPPVAPIEHARPPAPLATNKDYLATQDADGDWFVVVSENGVLRHLTEAEAKQLASVINEQGSNIITLYCRNATCQYKDTWIRRASADAKKNVYFCEGCKQPMIK